MQACSETRTEGQKEFKMIDYIGEAASLAPKKEGP